MLKLFRKKHGISPKEVFIMASIELARKIMVLTNVAENISSSMNQMLDVMVSGMHEASPDRLRRVIDAIKGVISEDTDVMVEITALGFVKIYSDAELKGLIEFYESDVGQAMLRKTPQLLETNVTEINAYQQAVVIPKIEAAIINVIKEIEEGKASEDTDKE